ncbi:hypothetical protein Nepgr_032289 [Nepenthes gracilis]|uniref:Uncharacterized protein n=1 Tax=Nepenthes gracilis TaxID=150966 RepID=A0AAD3TJQ8_NEPGR|nr:hypothetical protein Nepgr_032289 [Nepenthes gracilis]
MVFTLVYAGMVGAKDLTCCRLQQCCRWYLADSRGKSWRVLVCFICPDEVVTSQPQRCSRPAAMTPLIRLGFTKESRWMVARFSLAAVLYYLLLPMEVLSDYEANCIDFVVP